MDMQEEAVDTTHIEFGPQLPDKTSISSFTTAEQAQVAYALVVPEERAVASGFWSEFSHKWMLWGLKVCMLIFLASGGYIVPREFQMKATMALCSGFDALIDVGTGYGKTFCMILPALLFNGMITLVVSPSLLSFVSDPDSTPASTRASTPSASSSAARPRLLRVEIAGVAAERCRSRYPKT
ncbi:hypothetical protein CC1G_09283 [Coprinopsis cinerea okayama7|uniref:DEAD/DEAH-box helicase domain-containing protein n=1 Tax=Coprinopsis cinerea (strain Okayama-7 / 130 / ATCC MYA-4618 / FGSC 9003) TaxID=240176 RepID=A8N862_COPC7|nr:hypothetical protein CC1G_09283 [Coprinopsis cinerea okayama7\|eukprot:XP_001831018.1 hypothetical protein CC1G_09283 [Coprinopsis cinerea okayama7\